MVEGESGGWGQNGAPKRREVVCGGAQGGARIHEGENQFGAAVGGSRIPLITPSPRRSVCPITNFSATIARNTSPRSCLLSTTKRGKSSARSAAARRSSSAGPPFPSSRRRKAPDNRICGGLVKS